MTMQMTWKPNGKRKMARHLAARIESSFKTTLQWIAENPDCGATGASVNCRDEFYGIVDQYAYNSDWASKRQENSVITDALRTIYANQRADKSLGLTSYCPALMAWAEKKISEIKNGAENV